MDIGIPHRGRTFQSKELLRTLWIDNEDCELNAALYHHLVASGWKFDD